MEKFYCENCQKIFEAEGEKKEWQSSLYGKCWKMVAKCPVCKKECKEFRPSLTKKSSNYSCSGTCSYCSGCGKINY